MTSFLSSLFGRGNAAAAPALTNVSMITNFSACPLGLRLLDRLSDSTGTKVIAVSHDASRFEDKVDPDKVIMFEAFPNEEEDRNRLISFLLQNKMQVSTLVQNQPFMLKPTVDQPMDESQLAEKEKDADPAKLQML